jgi:hypothetical protein
MTLAGTNGSQSTGCASLLSDPLTSTQHLADGSNEAAPATVTPSETLHWLTHTNQSGWYYRFATGPDGRNVVWTRQSTPDGSCPGPFGWHVSKDKPDLPVVRIMGERAPYSQGLEENKETRIGQVLRRIVLAFSYSPPLEANKETRTEQQSSYSQWLEENRAKRCTVDLVELEQAWHAKAEAELARLLEAQARYDEFKALPLIVLPD